MTSLGSLFSTWPLFQWTNFSWYILAWQNSADPCAVGKVWYCILLLLHLQCAQQGLWEGNVVMWTAARQVEQLCQDVSLELCLWATFKSGTDHKQNRWKINEGIKTTFFCLFIHVLSCFDSFWSRFPSDFQAQSHWNSDRQVLFLE